MPNRRARVVAPLKSTIRAACTLVLDPSLSFNSAIQATRTRRVETSSPRPRVCILQGQSAASAALRVTLMMLTPRYNHRGELRSATVRRAALGLSHIMKTRYPLFFWGFPLARTDLPVVIYHDVSIEAFARDLEFLRVKGYRTIGLDEFTVSGNRKAASRERRVLLTFDDARAVFTKRLSRDQRRPLTAFGRLKRGRPRCDVRREALKGDNR